MSEELLWKDIPGGYMFSDNSVVTQIHETHKCHCYKITIDGKDITLSEDHLLLCDISRAKNKIAKEVLSSAPKRIPLAEDANFYINKNNIVYETDTPCAYDNTFMTRELCWLPVYTIHYLISSGTRLYLVRDLSDSKGYSLFNRTVRARLNNGDLLSYTRVDIEDIQYVGILDCFCVSTDTGRYQMCDIVHHNSVTLRNIIFHSLTHSDDIKIGLVDLKLSEFSGYKGMNNVVGVANSTREAAELLRLCREVMQKRNKQNADRGLTDYKDYKPEKPTDQISIFGEHFNDQTKFQVKIGEESKEMTAQEILEYVQQNYKSDK